MLDTFYQWYGQLDPHLRIYWSVALITSALFAVQMALTFIGLGHGDVDVDFQAADATPDGGLDGVDGAMQIFTVRNVINFLLGVSWGGVCLWDVIPSRALLALASVAIGFCFVAIFILLYKQMMRLQASGNIRIESAVGQTCQVYLRIPSGRSGTGKVQISFSGSVQEVDAQTDGEALPSGARVRVVSVIDSHTLLVTSV
jgi:hypothetical protein